jgi:hypothetical protein
LLANPHYPAATALLLLAIIWTQDGWEGKGWPAYGKAAGSAFILGFVHPFMIVPLSGILGGFVLRQTLQARRINWSVWFGTLFVGIIAVLGSLYT